MSVALYIIRVADHAAPRVPVFLGDATEFYRRTAMAIATLASGSVFPVGFIALVAQQSAPDGWLVCDGAAVSRATFPALYGALGALYGAGDGATTFNIPTQAQCVPPVIAPTPPQVIVGGSVVSVAAPVVTVNPVGGTGINSVTGGRVFDIGAFSNIRLP